MCAGSPHAACRTGVGGWALIAGLLAFAHRSPVQRLALSNATQVEAHMMSS